MVFIDAETTSMIEVIDALKESELVLLIVSPEITTDYLVLEGLYHSFLLLDSGIWRIVEHKTSGIS